MVTLKKTCFFHVHWFMRSVWADTLWLWVSWFHLSCVWSVSSEQRCELNCRAVGFRFYVRQADRVIDGTPCGRNQTSVCVAGQCQVRISYSLHYFVSRRVHIEEIVLHRLELQCCGCAVEGSIDQWRWPPPDVLLLMLLFV